MAYRRRADAVAAAHPDFVCPIPHALMRDPVARSYVTLASLTVCS